MRGRSVTSGPSFVRWPRRTGAASWAMPFENGSDQTLDLAIHIVIAVG